MAILIVFGTVEGHTEKIARFIKRLVQNSGKDAHLLDTSSQLETVKWSDFDTVILAASVHERKHPKEFEVFLTTCQKELSKRRVLMISVSLKAAFPEGLEEAQDYLEELEMRTALEPDSELLVAGAIKPEGYDYYETQILRHVVLAGRDHDPSAHEHEFTDWDALKARVLDFIES